MKMFRAIVILMSLFLFTSCGKDNKKEDKFCWQLMDSQNRDADIICDKTESELIECYRTRNCANMNSVPVLTDCYYYKTGGEKSCWNVSNYYIGVMTETKAKLLVRCLGYGEAVRSDFCDCAKWYHRLKQTFKPANTFTYSPVQVEQYCGDTLATLFPGRQILIREDADSLIVLQFSNNGVNW